jgi:hypothetical protein
MSFVLSLLNPFANPRYFFAAVGRLTNSLSKPIRRRCWSPDQRLGFTHDYSLLQPRDKGKKTYFVSLCLLAK